MFYSAHDRLSSNVIDDRYLAAFRDAILSGQIRFNQGVMPVLNNELMNKFLSLKMPTSLSEAQSEDYTKTVMDLSEYILRNATEIYIDDKFKWSQTYVSPTDAGTPYQFNITAQDLMRHLKDKQNIARNGHDSWVEVKADVGKMNWREQIFYAAQRGRFSDALGGAFADPRPPEELLKSAAALYAIHRADNPTSGKTPYDFMQQTGNIPVFDEALHMRYLAAKANYGSQLVRGEGAIPRKDDGIGQYLDQRKDEFTKPSFDSLYQSAFSKMVDLVNTTPSMGQDGAMPASYFMRPSQDAAIRRMYDARAQAEKVCTGLTIAEIGQYNFDNGKFDGVKFEDKVFKCVDDEMQRKGFSRE